MSVAPARERGSVTVEMALVLPLVVLLIVAIAEVAVAARTQLEVLNAAREGARTAAVAPDPADAVVAAKRALGELGDQARVRVNRPRVVGEPATVTVVVRHRAIPEILGGVIVELEATASMRVEV